MLYLEDYLEMIEHLPQELRDRFTDMREMDLTVQNNMDSFDKRIRTLFTQCRRSEIPTTQADTEYVGICKEYYKALEDADEKVQLANQMYDLVDRYLRRLDSELFKFKCELEADHNGITEILEKRSLELDGGSGGAGTTNSSSSHGMSQKENRYFGLVAAAANNHHHHNATTGGGGGHNTTGVGVGGQNSSGSSRERYRPKPEKRRDSSGGALAGGGQPEKRTTLTTVVMPGSASTASGLGVTAVIAANSSLSAALPTMSMRPITPTVALAPPIAPSTVSYSLQHIGAGNAIAAAASQAIAATQQMQQGRRTASLKASYEAIHGSAGNGAHELLLGGRELTSGASGMQTVDRGDGGSSSVIHTQRRHKKKIATTTGNVSFGASQYSQSIASAAAAAAAASAAMAAAAASSAIIPTVETTVVPTINVMQSPISTAHIVQPILVSTPEQPPVTSSNGATSAISVASIVGVDSGVVVEQSVEGEWNYDPNEPRYCICNQVSYGDMVACDNEACPFEWFHYPCVGITQSPKGKWYCPKCTASMKRRGARK